MTRLGLYRTREYRKQPPDDQDTVTAPTGEPVYEVPRGAGPDPTNELPPCPDCGCSIILTQYTQTTLKMQCKGCQAGYILHPIERPDSVPWDWQDGTLIPL